MPRPYHKPNPTFTVTLNVDHRAVECTARRGVGEFSHDYLVHPVRDAGASTLVTDSPSYKQVGAYIRNEWAKNKGAVISAQYFNMVRQS